MFIFVDIIILVARRMSVLTNTAGDPMILLN